VPEVQAYSFLAVAVLSFFVKMSPDAIGTDSEDELAEQSSEERRGLFSEPPRQGQDSLSSRVRVNFDKTAFAAEGPKRRYAVFSPAQPGSDRNAGIPANLLNGGAGIYDRILQLAHPSSYTDPFEAEHDLREFLKVVKPDWSAYRPKGYCEIDRVMAKLKAIGVADIWELMQRVETNVINEDLFHAGSSCFSEDTLELFRAQRSFLCALEHLREPYYRQCGLFAPVPQLLAKSNRWSQAVSNSKNGRRAEIEGLGLRPASGTKQSGNTKNGRREEVDGLASKPVSSGLKTAVTASTLLTRLRPDSNATEPQKTKTRQEGMPSANAPEQLRRGAPHARSTSNATEAPKTKTRQEGMPSTSRPSTAPDSSSQSSSRNPSKTSGNLRPRRISSAVAKTRSSSNTEAETSSAWDLESIENVDLLTTWDGPRCTSRQDLRFSRPGIPPRSCWSRPASQPRSPEEPGRESVTPTSPSRSSSVPAKKVKLEQLQTGGHLTQAPEARRASRSSGGSFGRQESSENAENAEDRAEAALQEEVEKIQSEGAAMSTHSREAKWNNLTSDTLLEHGQAVLAEQQAIHDKRNLYLAMSREGPRSVTRKVVSANIKCRLREEAVRDAKTALDVHYQCTSIRKHLNAMANARRDLSGARLSTQKVLEEEKKEEMFGCLRSRITLNLKKARDVAPLI